MSTFNSAAIVCYQSIQFKSMPRTMTTKQLNIFCSYQNHFMFLLVIVISATAPVKINSTNPLKMNDYPNYIWVYVQHHVTAQVGETVSLIFFVKKYVQVQKTIKELLTEAFEAVMASIKKCKSVISRFCSNTL